MKTKVQCGWEDECKAKSCLGCHRYMRFKNSKLTLAEAICISDFADVNLKQWIKEKPKEVNLAQEVMGRLVRRVVWK